MLLDEIGMSHYLGPEALGVEEPCVSMGRDIASRDVPIVTSVPRQRVRRTVKRIQR